jgi:hypothetical protein
MFQLIILKVVDREIITDLQSYPLHIEAGFKCLSQTSKTVTKIQTLSSKYIIFFYNGKLLIHIL